MITEEIFWTVVGIVFGVVMLGVWVVFPLVYTIAMFVLEVWRTIRNDLEG